MSNSEETRQSEKSCTKLGTNPVNPEPLEIIRLLAEKVMGWAWLPRMEGQPEDVDRFSRPMLCRLSWWPGCHGGRIDQSWNPLTSIADAYEMEGRIPEELRWPYLRALDKIVSPASLGEVDQMWAIRHATPEQMCKAAVATLKAGGRP